MAHEERYARPDQKPEETVHGEEEAPRTEHLSVGDIQRYTEELKAKVQAAQLQKEKDIEQKLTDRETLIAESRGNDALLNTAEEGLEYFTSVQELGLLTDPDDLRKLEDLKVLVDSLKEQSGEIEKKITAIAGQPEIFSKLYDAAEKKIERVMFKKRLNGRMRNLTRRLISSHTIFKIGEGKKNSYYG